MSSFQKTGRTAFALSLACAGVLLAGCQTTGPRGPAAHQAATLPPVVVAQSRGWLVERYVATGPGGIPYCVASHQSAGPDVAFVATSTSTGVIVKVGTPLVQGAVYDLTVAFDGGSARSLRGKPMGPLMLTAVLGGPDVGGVLSRFASASSIAVTVPNIGLRSRFDLDGSTWAINKLSECMHGVPARIKAPVKPTERPSASPAPTAPSAGKPSEKPAGDLIAPAKPSSDAVDLDLQQPVDLDAVIPNP